MYDDRGDPEGCFVVLLLAFGLVISVLLLCGLATLIGEIASLFV